MPTPKIPKRQAAAGRKVAAFWAANALLPLLAGLVIYVVWAADTQISATVRALLAQAGFALLPMRQPGSLPARFARNHLCDACWAYSLVFCLAPAMGTKRGCIRAAVCTAAAFAAALELLQKAQLINGTFDRADLIVEFVACIAAGVMLKCFVGRNQI